MQTSPVASTRPEQVLGKATARAAEALGLRGKQLAQVVGYSEPTVSRVLTGERGIDPSTKPGELALLLVRVFRIAGCHGRWQRPAAPALDEQSQQSPQRHPG